MMYQDFVGKFGSKEKILRKPHSLYKYVCDHDDDRTVILYLNLMTVFNTIIIAATTIQIILPN